jgi:hypothetical protein
VQPDENSIEQSLSGQEVALANCVDTGRVLKRISKMNISFLEDARTCHAAQATQR